MSLYFQSTRIPLVSSCARAALGVPDHGFGTSPLGKLMASIQPVDTFHQRVETDIPSPAAASPTRQLQGPYGLPDISGIPNYIRDMLAAIPPGEIDGRAVGACYMMKQPLTNAQFRRIMEREPDSSLANAFGYGRFDGDSQAVVMTARGVFEHEVARRMTELCQGVIVFRSPTADEWQHGAQAGDPTHEYPTSSGRFSTAEMNSLEGYQERLKRDPNATPTVAVTQYLANKYGLYPGDVLQYCQQEVLCGGNWNFNANLARAASRIRGNGAAFDDRGWRGVALASRSQRL